MPLLDRIDAFLGERRNPSDPLSKIKPRIPHEQRVAHLQEAGSDASMKDWYGNHRDKVTSYFDGNERHAALFNLCLGATSASTSVGGNWRKALHAMHNVVHNIPHTTGLQSHDQTVNAIREGYHAGKSAKEIAEGITSPKVGPYTRTLLGSEKGGTNDMHVGEFYIGRPPRNLSDHRRIDQLRKRDGEALGWSQEQVQSAAWTANIKRRGEKPRTYDDYAARPANKYIMHHLKASIASKQPLGQEFFGGAEPEVLKRAKEAGHVIEAQVSPEDDATSMGSALLVQMAQDGNLPEGALKADHVAGALPADEQPVQPVAESAPLHDVSDLAPHAHELIKAFRTDEPGFTMVNSRDIVVTKDEDKDPKFLAGLKAHPVTTAAKFMAKAIRGEVPHRSPLLLQRREDGKHTVVDGNATTLAVQAVAPAGVDVPAYVVGG